MHKKLLSTYILIIAVTVFVTVIFSWNSVNSHFYSQVESESNIQINLMTRIFEYEFKREDFDFQAFAKQTGNELVEQQTVGEEYVHILRRR